MDPRTGRAHVSYLAGASVYADAGRAEGLEVGDTVWISRAGVDVGVARVAYASTHRVSCDTLAVTAAIAVGDEVRFVPRAVAAPPVADGTLAAAPVPVPAAITSRHRTRGAVGFRHLAWREQGGNITHQPALDIKLDRRDTRWDLAVDLRTRRTMVLTDSATQSENSAHLYRLSATLRSSSRTALTLGRQQSPSLAPVSLFDGGLIQTSSRSLSFGAFGGTQPEPATWRFSDEVMEAGGFVEWRPALARVTRASFTAGGVTSYDRGDPNRDFAFVQGVLQAPAWSVIGAQEVDFGRAWERAQGEPAVGLSSNYLTARWAPERRWSLSAGYDGRRNVRLWRDHETPETDFDDQYYQGAWIGAGYDPRPWLRLGSDARYRTGSEDALTLGGSVEVRHFGVRPMSLRCRGSRYDGEFTEVSLVALSGGIDPWPGLHLEAGGGMRETREPVSGFSDRGRWVSVDLDLVLASRWYALASWDHEDDDFTGAERLMMGLRRAF